MFSRRECIELLKEAAPEMKRLFGVESMCLFGSVARGENIEGSDVDIFVKMPPKAFGVLKLKDYLQNLLGSAVDIIRQHPKLDSFLIQEIERDGITVF